MTRHTVNTITSDALDALYEQLEAAEESESQRQLATAREALASATTRAARAEAALARVQALADEHPAGIDTALIHAALDQTQAAPPAPGLYDKIMDMFGGPLPWPPDGLPETVLPCNHAQLRQPHDPHLWQPQPGMRHVQCPGYAPVPAATEATDTRVRSAIALYERWIKAGPPPLGTSVSRWWDRRLAELHTALNPTKEH